MQAEQHIVDQHSMIYISHHRIIPHVRGIICCGRKKNETIGGLLQNTWSIMPRRCSFAGLMIDVCFGFAAGLSVVREQQSRRLVNSMSVPSRQHAGTRRSTYDLHTRMIVSGEVLSWWKQGVRTSYGNLINLQECICKSLLVFVTQG